MQGASLGKSRVLPKREQKHQEAAAEVSDGRQQNGIRPAGRVAAQKVTHPPGEGGGQTEGHGCELRIHRHNEGAAILAARSPTTVACRPD